MSAETPPTFASPRQAARAYLELGLAVLDIPHRSKRPEPGRTGWQAERASLDDLDRRFPEGEPRTVCVFNGAPSNNLADVDLDCPQAVRAASVLLPRTAWVFGRESAPRSHRLYKTDVAFDAETRQYYDVDGGVILELRGTGGYTIWPGSTHRDSGEPIIWEKFDPQAGPLPITLAELQTRVDHLAVATLLARHWPAPDSRARHRFALAVAGGLARAGLSADEGTKLVYAAALAAGDEEARSRGYDARDTFAKHAQHQPTTGWKTALEVLGSPGRKLLDLVGKYLGVRLAAEGGPAPAALKKAPGRYVPRRPYRPFPVDLLPPVLSSLAREGAVALGVDPAFIALPALATAAGCIGNSRNLQVKRKWREPCVLWAATVAYSGSTKSGGFDLATGPVAEAQVESLEAHKARLEEYAQELDRWKDSPRGERGEKPAAVGAAPIFYTSDATIEGISRLLANRPRGLLLGRDELDAWFCSFTRYKGGGGTSDRAHWLEIHRAGVLRVDRADPSKPPIAVRRAAVSVTGTIQPRVLADALDARARAAGLGARLLLANPPKRRRVWTEADVPEDLAREYAALLTCLLALEPEDPARCTPYSLQLSPEAKEMWVEFFNEWGRQQYNADADLAAVFAKIEAYCLRLALLHHVVAHVASDCDDRVAVTETSMAAGIGLARWFAQEAQRVYALLDEGQEDREIRELVEWVLGQGGRTTARALQRSNAAKWPTSEAAEGALKDLEALGLGRWEAREGVRTSGRQPAPEFVLDLEKASDVSDVSPEEADEEGDGPSDVWPDVSAGPTGSGVESCDASRGGETGNGNGRGGLPGETSETSDGLGGGPDAEERQRHPSSEAETSDYRLVADAGELAVVAAALDETAVVGLDLETTGLNPRADRVRMLALAVDTLDGGKFAYLIDCSAVDPSPVLEALAGKTLVAHNALFDLGFLARLGFTPCGPIHCTLLLERLLTASKRGFGDCSLQAVLEKYLGIQVDKHEQRGDWSGELRPEQLVYAAQDVLHLHTLYETMHKQIVARGLQRVAAIESAALPAVVWATASGVAVDREELQRLAQGFVGDEERTRAALDALAPPRPAPPRNDQGPTLFPLGPEPAALSWNWNSPQQVRQAFALAGIELESTDDHALAALDHPLAAALRAHRAAQRMASSYGASMLARIEGDGRVYADWKQLGSTAGRMSCGSPNLQQVPKAAAYRRCFVAPPGRVLVKADYSQIELRIAVKVAGESAMIEALVGGLDLHRQTAQLVLGVAEPSKADRQIGKLLNFGLLYGMGAKRFHDNVRAAGVDMTLERAAELREAFFRAYPRLRSWQRRAGAGDKAVTTRTLAGRQRLEVDSYTDKLNSPVQGTGADGLKAALGLLWQRRDQVPGAVPVLIVHDEIVVECAEEQAEAVEEWLRQAMLDGMAPLIEPVPVEVAVSVGRTWAGE